MPKTLTKPRKKQFKTLRLILGDQLNSQHSWYEETDKDTLYLIAELNQEARYVKHHVQKLCAFFLAMEAFAKKLKKAGHQVLHLDLDESSDYKDLDDLLSSIAEKYSVEAFHYQRPDEWRLQEQLNKLKLANDIETQCFETEHFLLPFEEIDEYFKAGQHNKMEFFYRKMRKRFKVLMNGDKPLGDAWNFDADNRNKLKAGDHELVPEPLLFGHDIEKVLDRLKRHKTPFFGEVGSQLIWPITKDEAEALLEHFCQQCLPHFGQFQDAMSDSSPHNWTLFHSRLSFALNVKLISPKQVIDAATQHYSANKNDIDLAQIEGFVRQILGWREYVRGMYWLNMPSYQNKNHLNARRKLPSFFWDANTKMNCVHHAVKQSLEYAYAHHIQRLMITGNFALLSRINPKEVDAWYLGIYIDAIEWVELPNTRGMSQFADGGLIATKPYVAGGNYINKMSDYCKSCHYQVKDKTEDNACPFNSLYWHFIDRHQDLFENNQRMSMIYRSWQKQEKKKRDALLKRAEWCLDNLEKL